MKDSQYLVLFRGLNGQPKFRSRKLRLALVSDMPDDEILVRLFALNQESTHVKDVRGLVMNCAWLEW